MVGELTVVQVSCWAKQQHMYSLCYGLTSNIKHGSFKGAAVLLGLIC